VISQGKLTTITSRLPRRQRRQRPNRQRHQEGVVVVAPPSPCRQLPPFQLRLQISCRVNPALCLGS
jgi:hypothetical protein